MADIKIIVGYETVTQADQAFKILDKTVKSTARQYEQAFNKITGWQKRFSSEQNRVNASLNTNYLAQQKSNKSARDSARAFEESAKAQRGVAAAHELTRKKYVAGAAAGANLKRAQGELSAAYRVGVINIDEYRQALILLNQQNLGNRRSTNNLGVAMQQTGYQVGDFVVQVQSGQNPMVAFGQQATQLVGVMYLLPPAVLASTKSIFGLSVSVSALVMSLGIAIPILTAIGAAYMRFKKESDKAGKAVTELEERVKSLRDSLKQYKREKLAEGLGITADQFVSKEAVDDAKKRLEEVKQGYLDSMSSFNPIEVAKSLWSAFNPISSPIDVSDEVKALTEARLFLGEVNARLDEQQDKRANNQRYNLAQELALQQKIAKFGSDSAQVKSLELEQEIASRHRDLEAQRKSLELKGEDVDALKKQVEQTLRLEAANAKVGEQLMSHVKLYQDALETRKAEKKSADELILANENNLELLTLESQYTKDSVQYRKELVTQERERLEALVRTTGMQQYQADIQLSQFETQMDITGEMSNSADRAKDLADALKDAASAMASLLDTGSLEAKLAGLVAETNAIRSGANSAAASYVAIEGVKAAQKRDTALAAGVINPEFINDTYREKMEAINKVGAQRTIRDTERDNARAASRGAKKSKTTPSANAFEKLTVELARRKDLLNMSEAQATVTKGIWKLEDALGKDRAKYSAAELKAIVQKGIALSETEKAAEEAIAQQQAFADTLESSMSDAFTSMVDGTKSFKDAMKDMARAVIKQLFEVLVVQQMVGSFNAASGTGSGIVGAIMGAVTPQANGGAWQGGSQVQAYANGGVVNGPTTFGMSGGKTGLMGEAGPEAIMPLKRGSNGKLGVQMEGSGGGDNIVVHQNFNFQSNGDDSIKKLIAQAAPQISAMTKSSLLNDRRRGGATKAAFG
tara:strand:+ start:93 stop:2861 length:2769 start_codon:yes stop_codon:yes gene_type:complete